MIEKFKQPSECIKDKAIWRDRDGELHSFNGMPAFISISNVNCIISLLWFKNGALTKEIYIDVKSEINIIADKIKSRNFEKRAKKNKNKK